MIARFSHYSGVRPKLKITPDVYFEKNVDVGNVCIYKYVAQTANKSPEPAALVLGQ